MIKKRASSIKLSATTLPYQNQPKHPKHLDEKEYVNLMCEFFKKMVYYMIRDGARYIIPHSLGDLQIVRYNYAGMCKSPTKNKYVNFNATKQLKKRGINKTVSHNNKSTGGYWWRLHWFKYGGARFKTKKLYSVTLARPNRRPNSYNKNNPKLSVVPYFKDKGWEIYVETPKKMRK